MRSGSISSCEWIAWRSSWSRTACITFGMPVADDVDAEAAQESMNSLPLMSRKTGAFVVPLDRGVVGRDRLAVLQEARR